MYTDASLGVQVFQPETFATILKANTGAGTSQFYLRNVTVGSASKPVNVRSKYRYYNIGAGRKPSTAGETD